MQKTIFIVFFTLFYWQAKAQLCGTSPYLPASHQVYFAGGNVCSNDSFHLVFSDEFSGSTIDKSKWYTYFPGNNGSDSCAFCRTHGEPQVYLDTNVVENNGTLKLICKNETATWFGDTKNFTSGVIHSNANHRFKYGKFEARIKLPAATNLWPAYWFFGDDVEIDPIDMGTSDIHKVNCGIRNWNNKFDKPGAGLRTQDQNNCFHVAENLSDDFHVFTMEWSPYLIKFSLDGELRYIIGCYYSFPFGEIPTNITSCDIAPAVYTVNPAFPIYGTGTHVSLIFNLAVAGPFNDDKLPTDLPAQMEVDYIRVYQQNNPYIKTKTTTINLFPQPTKDNLTIAYSLDTLPNSLHYNLYDITGHLIISKQLPTLQTNAVSINIENLFTGIYLFELVADNQSYIRKLVKY